MLKMGFFHIARDNYTDELQDKKGAGLTKQTKTSWRDEECLKNAEGYA